MFARLPLGASPRRPARKLAVGVALLSIGASAVGVVAVRASSHADASSNAQLAVDDTAYPIPANAHFVAHGGDDRGPGSAAQPYATLAHAVAAATPGDTIVLRAGTYHESVPSIRTAVTIQPYPHETVWLDGSVVVTGFGASGSTWAAPWQSALCHTCYSIANLDPAYPAAGLPDQVWVDGAPLPQVTSAAALHAGSFWVDVAHSRLVLGSNPAGHTVEVTAFDRALQYNTGASGSVLRGIGVRRYGATYTMNDPAEVIANTPNITFDHDTFAWSSSRGLSILDPGGTVTNSTFVENGANGFHADHSDNLVFRNNVVQFSNNEHFSTAPTASAALAAAKITSARTVDISDNVFSDNDANGLWFDLSSVDVRILRNQVVRNAGHGIQYEVSGHAIIAGNVIAANLRDGVKLSGANDIEVWNNTLADNGGAQLGVYEDPRDANTWTLARGVTMDTTNVRSFNNVMVSPSGSSRPALSSMDVSSPRTLNSGQMLTASGTNAWVRAAASAPKFLWSWQPTTATNVNLADLATVQQQTGREHNSVALDATTSAALFVDPVDDDYTPKAGSPMAVAGTPLPAAVAAALGTAAAIDHLGALGASVAPATTSTTAPPTTTTEPPTTTTQPPTTTTVPPAADPSLVISNATVVEPDSGWKNATFTLRLSHPSAAQITVSFATANRDARAGYDFVGRSGVVTFAPGATTRTVVVAIRGDRTHEATEHLWLRLSQAHGATVADSIGVGAIVNDD